MLWSFAYYLGCSIAIAVGFLLVRMVYRWSLALKKITFYRDQGLFVLPGADRFIFGNLFDTLAYTTA